MKKMWPAMISITSALLLAGGIWIIGLVVFIRLIPLTSPHCKTPTEGIVVFTGGESRLTTALALFQDAQGKHLLISGVNPRSTFPKTIVNIPRRENITLGYAALDTPGNADETAQWARAHQIKTLRIITSTYHMPRSLFELRHLLPDVTIIPHCVVSTQLKAPQWWRNKTTLSLIVQEYNKLLFALIRHPFQTIHNYCTSQRCP